jgi:tetratricopeptide (TPR) repeat protein
LIRLESGKPADAVKYALQLTSAAPGNEKYLRLLARAQEAGSNFAGASDTWTRLLDSGIADARLLVSRAQCYRKTGEHGKALDDLNRYLELYPDDREAISLAGKTEAVTGDNLKAIELFSKNLKLHPGDPDCYIDRANSYLAAKSWDYAINDYSMSLDIKPGNADVWLNKGVALLGKGQVNDACHDFRRALSLGNKRASEYISRNCIR